MVEKLIKALLAVVVCLALTAAAGAAYLRTLPSYWHEEQTLNAKLDQMHEGNTAKLDQEEANPSLMKQWAKDVNVYEFAKAVMPSAGRSAALDNVDDAYHDVLKRQIPLKRQPLVPGWQNGWRTYFPAHQNILVTVSHDDSICSGYVPAQCYYADGPYQNWTPVLLDQKKTVEQDPDFGGNPHQGPGQYRALIARVCSGGCTPIVEPGFQFAVCGADPGLSGDVQLWTNGVTIIGPSHNVEDFWHGSNGYGFEANPNTLADVACATHPNQAIVPIPEQRGAAPTTLFAKK